MSSLCLTAVAAAYLLGSAASAVIVCRALGLADPRDIGSGNPGATNVLRLHGKKVAALTLAGDVLKGVPAILLLRYWQAPEACVAAAGLAALLGHLFPLYFRFRGGKGVATMIGVLLATHWPLGLAFILIWLLVAWLTRYSSLAAIVAALLTPLYGGLAAMHSGSGALMLHSLSVALMSLLLLWRHRANLSNLLAGQEDKIGASKDD